MAERADSHRPWPLPREPWIMAQRWHDLLFAHWPVTTEVIRAAVPPVLTLDLYEGTAWLGITPFHMSGVRLRGLPAVPWLSAFPELNVRTYVTVEGKPGVYFFSLDAGNPVAVEIARRWFRLPYYWAHMTVRQDGAAIRYRSRRRHRGAPDAAFVARYGPAGDVFEAVPGTLEHWLTERYCLYAVDFRQHIYRAEIHHRPWPLQAASAQIEVNTMTLPHDITLPAVAPRLHFARRQDVVVWAPERVSG